MKAIDNIFTALGKRWKYIAMDAIGVYYAYTSKPKWDREVGVWRIASGEAKELEGSFFILPPKSSDAQKAIWKRAA